MPVQSLAKHTLTNMAIPFLNNINLDDNQLQNAKLHVTSSAPTAAAGQIYFDSTVGTETAKYYDGSTWISLIQYTTANSTFVNLAESGTDATRTLTASLSATGTPSSTTFLRGDNTWASISDNDTTYDLTGTITKRNADTQELVSIPVNQSIVVIKEPNSAVVSADNMKVFYRGLRNPSSISIPGVAESSIRPSSNNGEFIKLSNGGWGAVPTSDFSKKTMKVSVSGVLNGKRKQFDGGEFRILEPPPGLGSIKVNDNYYKPTENIPKRYLSNGMITGNKPKDFLYDFIIEVTSFDIKVGNSPSKTVIGNSARSNPKAVADINSQGRGTVVRISNIKASAKDGDFVNPNYIVNDFIVILE